MLRRNELVSVVKDIIYTHYLKAKPLEPSVLAKEIVETILKLQQAPDGLPKTDKQWQEAAGDY